MKKTRNAYCIAVAVAALIVVLYKTKLVVGHCRSQRYSVGVKLVHGEVHGDVVGGKSVLSQQSLDLILVAKSPVADLSVSRSLFDDLLVSHCAGAGVLSSGAFISNGAFVSGGGAVSSGRVVRGA